MKSEPEPKIRSVNLGILRVFTSHSLTLPFEHRYLGKCGLSYHFENGKISMNRIASFIALVFCFASVSQAEFVIDNFDTGRGLSVGATLGQPALGSTAMDITGIGVTRTATITGSGTDWREGNFNNAPGPSFLNLVANQHAMRNNNGSGSLTLDYAFASDFDFTNTGQQFLQFHLFENVSPSAAWNYVVTLADGAVTSTLAGAVQGATFSGAVTLAAGDFAGLSFATTIDRISITLSGPNGGGLNRTNSGLGARIVAVPEPTSIALLGLTGIGGVLVARRRRKGEKAEEST